jgi:hypothetical protein
MNGQWIGSYAGTNSGLLVADLDEVDDHYEGFVYAFDNNAALPIMGGVLNVPKGTSEVTLRIPLSPLDRASGDLISPEAFPKRYPGVQSPKYADSEWKIASTTIAITWTTDIGTHATGEVSKSEAGERSQLTPLREATTWGEFKEYVSTLEPYRCVFRGQENSTWRLRTAFHRTGRAALLRYMHQDVSVLHRHLSGLTAHRFNLSDAFDYAAFLNLAQHHGYPTPFLDWTYSPFIGAYFAYKNIRSARLQPDQRVRILILDRKQWLNDFERSVALAPAFLHISIIEPLAINNPRVVPQQSVSTATNIDDLEAYIKRLEESRGRVYLRAIDLPARDRRAVMSDLGLMGISAGALLPGLDGACEQLKERFFDL